jgi:hypothetical protein
MKCKDCDKNKQFTAIKAMAVANADCGREKKFFISKFWHKDKQYDLFIKVKKSKRSK